MEEADKGIFMKCVTLLLYRLIYQEIISIGIGRNVTNDLKNDLFWECTRLFMLIGFIPNTLQEILCSMNSFICCFSTSFCIHFQSFRGFLICGASLLAGLCVVRDFAGGVFKQTCLKITNNLISNA